MEVDIFCSPLFNRKSWDNPKETKIKTIEKAEKFNKDVQFLLEKVSMRISMLDFAINKEYADKIPDMEPYKQPFSFCNS